MNQHDPYTPIIKSLRYINCCETEEQFLDRLRLTRPIMRGLRKAYKCCPCHVDYSGENIRAAYMLGYYPYYIEIVHKELSNLSPMNLPSSWRNDPINACFFGGGPCPEIIGWLAFLSDHFPDIRSANAFVFDKYNESWKVCREITRLEVSPNYWSGEVNILPVPYDLLDFDTLRFEDSITAIRFSNLFVMQNCLNDQPGSKDSFTNCEQIIRNLLFIIDQAPNEFLILVADLNFPRSQSLMKKLELEIQQKNLAVPSIPVGNECHTIVPALTFHRLLDELFTGEDGLVKKKYTRYYSSLIYKMAPE